MMPTVLQISATVIVLTALANAAAISKRDGYVCTFPSPDWECPGETYDEASGCLADLQE